MPEFLDYDAEDAYDASDPVAVRLRILAAAFQQTESDVDRRSLRRQEIVRLLQVIAQEIADVG